MRGHDDSAIAALEDAIERLRAQRELRKLRDVVVVISQLGATLPQQLVITSAGDARTSPMPAL